MVYCIHRQHYQCIGFHIKDGSKDRDIAEYMWGRDTVFFYYTLEADIVSVSYIIILENR
jgi:hypothetical protein